MNYYNDIKDLIGHTPMLKINHLNVKNGVNLFAKLEQLNPGGSIKAVLADPIGSIIGGGNINKEYRIEGIGNDFIPETMDVNLIDDVIKISDKEAYDMVREAAKKEGLIVGSSSGAALFASIKLSKSVKEGSNIVTLLPDRGDRYFSENIY